MSDHNQSNDQQMSASEEMFPVVNRELFDAVVALNAANGVKANELNRILQDLIAELRAAHHPMADLDGEPRLCVQGCGILPCHSLSAAANAEARLREVTGDEIVAAAIVVDYLRQLEDLDALSQFAPPRHDTPTQTTRQHTQ